MVPDPSKACVGLEYFCFEGDELWRMEDDKLVELGMRELDELDIVLVVANRQQPGAQPRSEPPSARSRAGPAAGRRCCKTC